MPSMTMNVPTMFGDHHVLQVRKALLALDGVDEVYASSAWQAVIVIYDADRVTAAAIEQTLTQAGYAQNVQPPLVAQSGERFIDPAWEAIGVRATKTNDADVRMSGDFRKY